MYVILGATGHVGRVIAESLLQLKLSVRVVMRNPQKVSAWSTKGAEVVIASLADQEALINAFSKATGVFIMTPPLLEAQDPIGEHLQMLHTLSGALEVSRPGKLVYLSSVGAHLPTGTGAIKKLYDMEHAFQRLRLPTAAIRAAWFMENFEGAFHQAKSTASFTSMLQPIDDPLSMVATTDIGQLGSDLLRQNWEGHRVIELEGPCTYSTHDVVQVMRYYLGRNITAVTVPDHEYEQVYQRWGASPNAAAMMAQMTRGFNKKHITFQRKGIEQAVGSTLLEDVIKTFAHEKR